jgi:hypothetical protein
MNKNHAIGTRYDLQTPLLSLSQLEEVDQSRFSTLDESEAESTSRYQEVHRLSSSSIDSINYGHPASFTANRILPRDAPFYQSKVRKKERYRYHFVTITG